MFVAAAAQALAGEPQVQFDVEPLVAVRDVTTPQERAEDPSGRRVQARLRVSVLHPSDSTRELAQWMVRIESPDRSAQVVEYAPRTTLTSEVAGAVRVDRREESNRSLDFQLRGQYFGFADGNVKGSSSDRSTTDSHWEKLPPLELCVASGTVNRGFGAYFKFKPSPRSTLEGAHDIELTMRVPRSWRGECLAIRCEAYSREPLLVGGDDAPRRWTNRRFLVALYQAGDPQTRAAALEVLKAEGRLRLAVAADRQRLEQSFAGSGFRELAGMWSGRNASEMEAWWDRLVYGPTAGEATVGRVPEPIRTAAHRYRESRLALRQPSSAAPSEMPLDTAAVTARLERLPPVED